MNAISAPMRFRQSSDENTEFLKLLPAVETHASISFRHRPENDREEAIAEAKAAAFVNYESARRRGNLNRLTPSSVARYAVLHTQDGRHVGGPAENTKDVMSRKAQRVRGFRCRSFNDRYDCMKDPTAPVWKHLLSDHGRDPVSDLACFRIDWSDYLRQQHDRTRVAISMLAEGYKRSEVADRLGTTRPAETHGQGRARMETTWAVAAKTTFDGQPRLVTRRPCTGESGVEPFWRHSCLGRFEWHPDSFNIPMFTFCILEREIHELLRTLPVLSG